MRRLIPIVLLLAAMPAFGQITKGKLEELKEGQGTVEKVLDHRMTPPELAAFLKKRTSGQMMGNFDSYTSLLWAVDTVGVWNEGTDTDNIPLHSPFPENYKPTWKELMDDLARQVKCSWHYNHDTGYWVFDKKIPPPPFTLKIAEGWTNRDDGQSIVFIPPIAPVGLDVYVMGHYSSDEPAKLVEVFADARKHVSILFARNFKPDVSEKDFSTEKVCGEKALFFSATSPRDPKIKWRQWAFVKNGWCFVIVSAIREENESRLFKDVKKMIASFKVSDKN